MNLQHGDQRSTSVFSPQVPGRSGVAWIDLEQSGQIVDTPEHDED